MLTDTRSDLSIAGAIEIYDFLLKEKKITVYGAAWKRRQALVSMYWRGKRRFTESEIRFKEVS